MRPPRRPNVPAGRRSAAARGAGAQCLVRRIARAAWRHVRRPRGRGRDAARPQRRRQDDHAALDHGHRAAARGLDPVRRREIVALASNRIAQRGIAYCPEERGIFASLDVEENLLLPPIVREGGLSVAQIFELFPNLKERLHSQGTKLSGGEQQMLAIGRILRTGREAPAARRAHRGPGAGDRPADRPHDREAQGAGLHDPAGRAEFPLCRDRRGSALRDGPWPRRRHDSAMPISKRTWRNCTTTSASSRNHRDFEPARRIGARAAPQRRRRHECIQTYPDRPGRGRACSAGAAQAQISDNVVKIGVLSDMSSLYTDLAGAGSVAAAKMAVEDSGIEKRGIKVEIVSADHQNKPDVGSAIARQWYDTDKVDVIVDVPNSGVALAVNQITKDKGKAFLVSGAASSDLTGKACSPNTVHWAYDTWMLANGTGSAIVKSGGDTWFFLTADYAFGHALEARHRGRRAQERRQGAGQGARAAQHPGLLVVPAAGAGVEGQDHRPRQCRRRYDELDQAGGRIRHREGRAESGRVAGVHHRRPLARACRRRRA